MLIEAVQADITTLPVDAIVNAANGALQAGSGVCGAIFAAAGHRPLQDACDELVAAHGRVATGDAVATPGFALPARLVIHAVGPVWRGGASDEDALLASTYRRALEVADAAGARSVAFPAVSTGVFAFPPDRAAGIAVEAIRSTPTEVVSRVVLCAFDRATYDRYVRLLAEGG
ncbi:MAG: macro domain-containing protein [Acidimicrobiales bacterium]|nr:macro domain-containing protein [Acidimicrobiales bacterium]